MGHLTLEMGQSGMAAAGLPWKMAIDTHVTLPQPALPIGRKEGSGEKGFRLESV
jgi:hypothetical protein